MPHEGGAGLRNDYGVGHVVVVKWWWVPVVAPWVRVVVVVVIRRGVVITMPPLDAAFVADRDSPAITMHPLDAVEAEEVIADRTFRGMREGCKATTSETRDCPPSGAQETERKRTGFGIVAKSMSGLDVEIAASSRAAVAVPQWVVRGGSGGCPVGIARDASVGRSPGIIPIARIRVQPRVAILRDNLAVFPAVHKVNPSRWGGRVCAASER